MEDLTEQIGEIRDLINKPRKLHALISEGSIWFQLCSSMDVVEDAELAIDAYLSNNESDEKGEQYLRLYGVLQALFLQQDAVEHLSEALNIKNTKDDVLKEIRDTRNYSIGHPTKADYGKAFNFISRPTLNKHGFGLLTEKKSGESEYSDINVLDLITKQRDIHKSFLAHVILKLQEEEARHKEQFRGEKLSDAFPSTLGYCFAKVNETISGNMPKEFGAKHLEYIDERIKNFCDSLETRGLLTAYDSVTDTLNQINYTYSKLFKYFNNPDISMLDERDAFIYLESLRTRVNEIIVIAKELDEDYAME